MIMNFQVVDVDAVVTGDVTLQNENFAACLGLVGAVIRLNGLKERGLVRNLIIFALGGITGGNQFFQAQQLKVLRKELGEVAPLRVVARQQHGLATKHMGVVVEIGVDFLLDVGILRIEFVVLRSLGI